MKFQFNTASTLTLLASVGYSQTLDNTLSLPDGFEGKQAGFDYYGNANPQNNKVLLTAIDRPNEKSAVWAKNALNHESWTVEMALTVGGRTDPGTSGFAFWYTPDKGQLGPVHGSKDNWDGLGVFLDSHGGQGTLRGQLNDGAMKYESESNPLNKAFSMCKINYRNTGNQFHIRVGYDQNNLIVDVNGQKCFETDKVKLPRSQFIGVSAASDSTPDSFSLHQFKVYDGMTKDVLKHKPGYKAPEPVKQAAKEVPKKAEENNNFGLLQERSAPPQQDPRLDDMIKQLDRTHDKLASVDVMHGNVKEMKEQIAKLEQRLDRFESMIKDFIKSNTDFKAEHKQQFSKEMNEMRKQLDSHISRTVSDHTHNIMGSIPDTINQAISKGGPSIWVLFVIIIFVQGVLVVGYNVYKTRRSYHAKIL